MSDTDEPATLRAQVEAPQRLPPLWPHTDIVPLRFPRAVTGKPVR